MTELAHIRDGQIVRRYSGDPPKGWVEWLDGSKTSPPGAGLSNGAEKVVLIERVTNDTSTTEFTVSATTELIEANRVLVTTDIRDKTQEELDAEGAIRREKELARVLSLNSLDRAQFELIFELANRVRALEGGQPYTKQQFISHVEGKMQ